MEPNGGVRGVAAILCCPLTIPDPDLFSKWERISLINGILFKTEEIKVWRAYSNRVGKTLSGLLYSKIDYLEISFITDPFYTAAMFARNNRFRTLCIEMSPNCKRSLTCKLVFSALELKTEFMRRPGRSDTRRLQ